MCVYVCARDGGRDWSRSQSPAGSLAPITVPCTSAAILLSTECVRALCPHTHTHTHTLTHTEHQCGSNKNFTNSLKLLLSPAIPINLYLIFSVSHVSLPSVSSLPRFFFFSSCSFHPVFALGPQLLSVSAKMGLDVAQLLRRYAVHPRYPCSPLFFSSTPLLLSHPSLSAASTDPLRLCDIEVVGVSRRSFPILSSPLIAFDTPLHVPIRSSLPHL